MEELKMKKAVFFTCLFTMVLFSSTTSFAGKGPDVMNLKEVFEVKGKKRSVIFPHHKHQAKVACASCHSNPDGGGSLKVKFVKRKGVGNDFHKKFCWPCHVEMKVSKGKRCSTCHNGSK
jgi:hypothetical protein